jgi:hypothetical protein
MINTEDEILIDIRTSCTKDEAAAKMLGWMRGSIRRKFVRVTEQGISADQLPSLHSFEGSLQEHLQELHEAARLEFVRAVEKGAATTAIQAKEERVSECRNLISKAASYLMSIDEELAKDDLSDLKIDRSATTKTGVVHVTLRSLDQWAIKNYGISVIAPMHSLDGEFAIDRSDERQEHMSEASGGLGSTSAKHLYTTLAFLVEAFSKTAPKYHKSEGSPNVSAIADYMEKAAEVANKGPMAGQGKEAIKKRIAAAMKAKKEGLEGR